MATIRIQNKIKKYYYKYDKDIEKYRDDMYVLEYVPLNEFLNTNEIILWVIEIIKWGKWNSELNMIDVRNKLIL